MNPGSKTIPSPNPTPLTLEMLQRKSTLEALRASNSKIEGLLAHLRILRTDALILERPINLEFTELILKIVIS